MRCKSTLFSDMTGPKLPRTRRSVHPKPLNGRDVGLSPNLVGGNHSNATSTRKSSSTSRNGSNALDASIDHSRLPQAPTERNSNGLVGVDTPLMNQFPQEPPLAESESDGVTTCSQHESIDGNFKPSVDHVDMSCRRPSAQSGSCSCGPPPSLSHSVRQKNGMKKSSKLGSADDIDYIPVDLAPSVFDLLGNIVGIGSYLSDVVTDCWVAYTHFVRYNWWWFSLTLGFVIIPSLVMTFFSTVWYIQEHRDPHHQHIKYSLDDHPSESKKKKVSTRRWVSRFILLFFQVAPVLR